MSKHDSILAAIDNLTERVLQIASDLETLKDLINHESIHARIEITEDERDMLNNPNGDKPCGDSEF